LVTFEKSKVKQAGYVHHTRKRKRKKDEKRGEGGTHANKAEKKERQGLAPGRNIKEKRPRLVKKNSNFNGKRESLEGGSEAIIGASPGGQRARRKSKKKLGGGLRHALNGGRRDRHRDRWDQRKGVQGRRRERQFIALVEQKWGEQAKGERVGPAV